METLIFNSHAKRDYTILEEMEAGIVLSGQEVKSVRLKRASIYEAFVKIINEEAFLVNAHIQQYDHSPNSSYDPTRSRKLLLHKSQVRKLMEFSQTKGLSIIPLVIGSSHHFVKLRIGVGKGKKQYERKEELKQRDIKRETDRVVKQRKYT